MNKTVVVTGGGRGIGAAVSSLFAENGYNVVIGYNTSQLSAQALKNEFDNKGYTAEIFKADVSDSNQAKALIDFAINTFGSVDVLVNNAGVAEQKLFTDIDIIAWNKMISVNLTGVYNCCHAVSKHMVNKKRGSIINISSIWGISGASCEVHYSSAKAGVIGLTKALAKELGPSKIRVNCIAPGVIRTDMNAHLSDSDLCELIDSTPLCRIGEPMEIAKPVLFLASDDASFITGQVIAVDGGFLNQ